MKVAFAGTPEFAASALEAILAAPDAALLAKLARIREIRDLVNKDIEAVRALNRPCVCVVITSDKCYENQEWAWGYRETDPLDRKSVV